MGAEALCPNMETPYAKGAFRARPLSSLLALPGSLGTQASALDPPLPRASPSASGPLHARYCSVIEYEIVSSHLDAIGSDVWITA